MDSLPPTPPPPKTATAVGARPRFVAKLVDLALVVGSGYSVFYLVSRDIGTVWIFCGWLLYNWLMIATFGATLGKMMIGAVVVTKSDVPCGWGRSLGRVLLEYLYLVPLVGLLSIFLFDKAKRTPLDHTAGTRVVKRGDIPQLPTRARFRITKSVGFRLAACALFSLVTGIGKLTNWWTDTSRLRWDDFAPAILIGVACSVTLLFAVPFLTRIIWRFLLDRIAEIAQAIRGHR